MKEGCIISPWLFNVYMEAVMKWGWGRWEGDCIVSRMQMTQILFANRKKTESDGGTFRRRGLEVNADKSKVMVFDGKEGLECEIRVDETRLE